MLDKQNDLNSKPSIIFFHNGFSLVEIMVALGIVSIIAYVVITLLNSSLMASKHVQLNTDRTNLENSILLVLSDNKLCSAGLQNAAGNVLSYDGTKVSVNQIAANGMIYAKVNNTDLGIRVESMELNPIQDLGQFLYTKWDKATVPPTPSFLNYHKYLVQLKVTINKVDANPNQPTFFGGGKKIVAFNLTVLTDSSKKIVDCFTEDSAAKACDDLGGEFDSTANPRCMLKTLGIGARNPPTSGKPSLLIVGKSHGIVMTGDPADVEATNACAYGAGNCKNARGAVINQKWVAIGDEATGKWFFGGPGQITASNKTDVIDIYSDPGKGIIIAPWASFEKTLQCAVDRDKCKDAQGAVFNQKLVGIGDEATGKWFYGEAGHIAASNKTDVIDINSDPNKGIIITPWASAEKTFQCAVDRDKCKDAQGAVFNQKWVAVGDEAAGKWFYGEAGHISAADGTNLISINANSSSGIVMSSSDSFIVTEQCAQSYDNCKNAEGFFVNKDRLAFGQESTSKYIAMEAGRIEGSNGPGNIFRIQGEKLELETSGGQKLTISGTNLQSTTNITYSAPTHSFSGDIVLTGMVTASSDLHLKKDIDPLTNALEKIKSITGVTYHWKDSKDQSRQIGVIAQDVQKAFPEAVRKRSDGYLSVNYMGLIAPVIEAIKTLSQSLGELAKEVFDNLTPRVSYIENEQLEMKEQIKLLREELEKQRLELSKCKK